MSETQNQKGYVLSMGLLSNERLEVSNAEFLHEAFAISAAHCGDCCPVTVSFVGNPSRDARWVARPFTGNDAPESDHANNYFALSAFMPDLEGTYHRRKKSFAALFVVALDDVTPVVVEGKQKAQIPFSRVSLPPTYVLETSEGNFQVGYFLHEPILDRGEAEDLSKAIIASGLSDPGASGPCARLMRLPIGCNGKYQPEFRCRLRLWAPERRYTIDELREGLQIRSLSASRVKQPTAALLGNAHPAAAEGNAVYTPAPTTNIVLQTLSERGLLKREVAPGKYELTCPWVNEHTGQVDSGAVYWAPDENHPHGAFKCQHGHCIGRGISELLDYLGIDHEAALMKARITTAPGEVNRIVAAAETELARTELYFQRSGRVVRLERSSITGNLQLQEVNANSLLVDLSALTRWQHYDGRSKKVVPCDPSPKYLSAILESGRHQALPEVIGIARHPMIDERGAVSKKAGYNAANKLYADFDERAYEVLDCPTQEDALKALAELETLLEEFPFEAECDKSAALSAILTAVVRSQLKLAPMIHVQAHLPGSGKSYLTALIAAFATGDEVAASSFPKDDEECRKFLHSQLLASPAAIIFDNLTTDIYAFKSLCMAITEPTFNARILGSSRTAEASTRTLILSSGNNVGPVEDMTRRVLTIYLNPAEPNPAERTFQHPNLIDELRANRAHFVSCALTVISAWMLAGRPRTNCMKTLNSFMQWGEWCRLPLLWLGRSDPATRLFELMANDPEREQTARIFDVLHRVFNGSSFSVKNVATKIHFSGFEDDIFDAFEEAGLSSGGSLDRRRLGWWFRRKNGWTANGLKLVKLPSTGKQIVYRLEVQPSPSAKL